MENNNQDIKLCPSCGFKNKSIYKYCNECGAPLNQSYYSDIGNNRNSAPTYQMPDYNSNPDFQYNANQTYYNGQFTQGGYTPYAPYKNSANAPYFGTPDFNGVAAKDVYEFTGEKTEFFDKLKTQHFSGKKGPFCWPLFFLGFLFSFFGMGCWFLYHKMYKPAIGFFAATVAEILLTCFVVFSIFGSLTPEQIKIIFETPEMTSKIMDSASSFQVDLVLIVLSVLDLVVLTLAIVLPFFAYKWYKNHALNRIRNEYTKSPIPNLKSVGGSNGSSVTIISISYAAIIIAAIVLLFMPLMKQAPKRSNPTDGNNSLPNYSNELPYGGQNPYGEQNPYGGQNPFGGGYPYGEQNPFGEDFPFSEDDLFGDDFPFSEDDLFGDGGLFGDEFGGYSDGSPFTEEQPKGEYW